MVEAEGPGAFFLNLWYATTAKPAAAAEKYFSKYFFKYFFKYFCKYFCK